MRQVLCKNGHFFDLDETRRCPVCGSLMAADDFEEDAVSEIEQNFSFETTVLPSEDQDYETTVLSSEDQDYETTVLPAGDQDYETTVLPSEDEPSVYAQDYRGTTVLPSEDQSYETTVLSEEAENNETTVLSSEMNGYETTVLSSDTDTPIQIVSPVNIYASSSVHVAMKPVRGGYYCYHCFNRQEQPFEVCPVCGEKNDGVPKIAIQLNPGTILQDRYVIGLAVGQGGFGIVYRAYDTKLEVVVAIKEYFPRTFANRVPGQPEPIVPQKSVRDYQHHMQRFLAEARTMAQFGNHRSIPNVFEFFEENNTTYFVMEYLDGISLRDYIIKNGGHLDQEFATFIATEVGMALKSLHEKGIVHLDVAPDNIFICFGKETKVKLMDLGAARLADGTESTDRVLKPGFAPPEQYDERGNLGPWTDIYALGATMYVMLTGVKPDESTNRKIQDKVPDVREVNPLIGENLNNTVMKAMAVEPHMRFKNVDELLKAMNGEKQVISLAKEKKRRRARQVSGVAAALIVLGLIAFLVFGQYFRTKHEEDLQAASIDVWFSVAAGSNEESAMETIVENFLQEFTAVKVNLKAIPEEDYQKEIQAALQNGTLPDLFESTGLSSEVLSKVRDAKDVLSSDQAKECLFLNQYSKYYGDYSQIPLGIEVPLAFVITNGASKIDYEKDTFTSLSDLGEEQDLTVDDRYSELVLKNFPNLKTPMKLQDFMDNEENKSPVLLSSSMILNEVRQNLTNYEKSYVFFDNSKIYCRYTYEWSLGQGDAAEEKAAERLLSWMLGNAYQSFLMITEANDGQLPLNEVCFNSKIDSKYLAPIKNLYKKFVFER